MLGIEIAIARLIASRGGEHSRYSMMSEKNRYPRKGEYGEAGVRCGWCGKPLPGEMPQEGGNYCSFDCSAAGRFYPNLCMGLTLMVIAAIMIIITIRSGIENPNPQTSTWPFSAGVFVVLSIITIYFIVAIKQGYRVRSADRDARWKGKVIDTEDELTTLHHRILDFVAEIPANEGITKRQIIEKMDGESIPIGSTKTAISELVGGGFLEEINLGRYIIGKVRRRRSKVN